jgi:hypothetical protein
MKDLSFSLSCALAGELFGAGFDLLAASFFDASGASFFEASGATVLVAARAKVARQSPPHAMAITAKRHIDLVLHKEFSCRVFVVTCRRSGI